MFEIIFFFCSVRRRRTITVYKMVFNEEPNALIWEDNAMPNPSSRLILTPKLKPIGKGMKSILFEMFPGRTLNPKKILLALKVSLFHINRYIQLFKTSVLSLTKCVSYFSLLIKSYPDSGW